MFFSKLTMLMSNHFVGCPYLPYSPIGTDPVKEYHPDCSVLERTTREWARSIKNLEGNALAQCDLVNGGGLDQLSYLLFPPQHTEAANNALNEYRKRLYPFSQREEKFRERVGPPPSFHLSKNVIANIEFIQRFSSTKISGSTASSNALNSDNITVATPNSGITESTASQVARPMTPAESLRQQYSQRSHNLEATDESFEEESTAASTATASKLSDGRMSTSSAKLIELDAVIQREKKTNEKEDAQNSERISLIEQQLHRINNLDSKLDDAKTDFGHRLLLFETRVVDTVKGHIESSNHNMENMNTSMEN